jgi:hypothetical protein
MERLLIIWTDDQTSCHVPLNQTITQNKAHNLFNDKWVKKGEAVKGAEFGASHGRFDRFKKRSNLHNIKVQGQAGATDTVDVESFPQDLAKITDDGGYMKHKIFNVDETGLLWKISSHSGQNCNIVSVTDQNETNQTLNFIDTGTQESANL